MRRRRASNDDIDIEVYQRGRIMMSKVTFDYSKACSFVQEHEMQYMSELAAQAKDKLLAKTGAGNDFLGWIDLPVDYDKEEFARIKKAAEKIREDSEVLLVIGIADPTWEPERPLSSPDILLQMWYRKRSARLRRSIM